MRTYFSTASCPGFKVTRPICPDFWFSGPLAEGRKTPGAELLSVLTASCRHVMTAATVLSPVVAKLTRAVCRIEYSASSSVGPVLASKHQRRSPLQGNPLAMELKVLATVEHDRQGI